jgi:hypothetical protein
MTRYAANTEVSCDRSRAEIESIIRRYGASQFVYGWSEDKAMIGFACNDRNVRFELPLPSRDDPEFAQTPAGRRRRSSDAQEIAWEQACRQRWRALALVIKAKLEAVDAEITTFEDEFLAHIVLPGGQTVGQAIVPRLEGSVSSRSVIALLSGPGRQTHD